MKKAVVLLSGGLDSSTCLWWTLAHNYKPFCLLFDYGQRHKKELKCAIRIARKAKATWQVVRFRLPWGGSALTDRSVRLPRRRKLKEMISDKIPPTYVPARNTIFLSFALSFADAIKAETVVLGANAIDFSGYPDCLSYGDRIAKVLYLCSDVIGRAPCAHEGPFSVLHNFLAREKFFAARSGI